MSRHASKYELQPSAPARRARPEPTEHLRVALIGCGKEKRGNEQGYAYARDLYVSQLFRAALAHVEAGGFDAVYILSALHGALQLTDPVRIYDYAMSDKDADERAFWAHDVMCCQLAARHRDAALELHVFAGELYVEPLRAQLPELPGWSIVEPLAGLQVGERLAWFKQRRAA